MADGQISVLDPATIRALRRESPQSRARDFAAANGIPEACLLYTSRCV